MYEWLQSVASLFVSFETLQHVTEKSSDTLGDDLEDTNGDKF